MSGGIGRGLVVEVITRWAMERTAAEQVVAFVLAEVVADLERCRATLATCDEHTERGVRVALARMQHAAGRVVRGRAAPR